MDERDMAGYLGDKKTMIVHHLGNKQKGCDIYHVKKNKQSVFYARFA